MKYIRISNILIFILCLTTIHCLYVMLLNQPLRLDELTTYNLIDTNILVDSLYWLVENDTQQPLFYILAKAPYLFHRPFISIKLMSLLFTLLASLFHFKTSRLFLSSRKSVISTLFFLNSFLILLHSSEVRPYGLFLFLTAVSNFYFLKYLIASKNRWYLYTISMTLALITHLSSFFLLATHLVLGLKPVFKSSTRIKIVIFLVSILFFYFFGSYIFDIFNHDHEYRLRPSIQDFINHVIYLFNGANFLFVSVFIIIFGFKRNDKSWFYLASLAFLPTLLIFIKSSISSPVFESRYLIYSVSPFVILLFKCLEGLKIEKGAVFLLLTALLLVNNYEKERIHEVPYRIDSEKAAHIYKEKYASRDYKLYTCNVCLKAYVDDPSYKCDNKEEFGEDYRLLVYVSYQGVDDDCINKVKDFTRYRPEREEKIKGLNFEVYYRVLE